MNTILHCSRYPRKRTFSRIASLGLATLALCACLSGALMAAPGATDNAGEEAAKLAAVQARVVNLAKQRPELIEDTDRLTVLYDEARALEVELGERVHLLADTITKLEANLQSLGPAAPATDPEAVARERRKLENEKKALEGEHATARLALLNVTETGAAINKRQKSLAAERWLTRGAPSWSVFKLPREDLAAIPERFQLAAQGLARLAMPLKTVYWYVALASILTMVGILLCKLLRMLQRRGQWSIDLASRSAGASLLALSHYLPSILLLAAVYFSLETSQASPVIDAFVTHAFKLLLLGLGVMFVARVAIWPVIPGLPFSGFDEATRACLYRRLRMLVLVGVLGRVLLDFGAVHEFPPAALDLLTDIWVVALVVLVFMLSWRIPGWRATGGLRPLVGPRVLVVLVLLSVLVSMFLGYRNLALGVLRSGAVVLGALALTWFVDRLIKSFFEGLVAARGGLRRLLRAILGLRGGATWPGLIAFQRVIRVLVWLGAAALALEALNVPRPILTMLDEMFTRGFVIGELQVVPLRLLLAVLSFAILYVFFGWLRLNMDKRWLPASRMSGSAREATVTLTGYAGLALAALVALSVAGATFTNLAIIAGALSVGIGFGLQNIVNNFISGLILLFERPVKTGDWVVVNGTEGYVRKISIRSTHIETFDKSDVIVPNSDLISNQVTNWMYNNKVGRVRVPIGVAYGSDTAQVSDILERIAKAHENVIQDDSNFPIRVMFMAFGDSALLFELRCFIKDVDNRLRVHSDINFAIDAAFREAGIQIPFPQRDVHVYDNR